MSAALANRSAGSFCRAVCTVAATAGGTVRLSVATGTGSDAITLATMACAVGPSNGGSPVSISYITQPSA